MKYLLIIFLVFFNVGAQAADAVSEPQKIPEPPARYEQPTMENLSKLYWALSLIDKNNDTYIDNYLLINQCDVYRDYYNNEFEWKNIRESARDVINTDINTFPTRFEFTQPLKLGRYDLQNQIFEVLKEFKIQPTTRFELYSSEADRVICEQQHAGRPVEIEGYPRSMIMEFNRPFSLNEVKVHPEIAESYIKEKMIPYNKLKAEEQIPERLYDLRDAYIVLQVRMLAPKTMEYLDNNGRKTAQILGVLEGYKIFADPELTLPMYEERFRK